MNEERCDGCRFVYADGSCERSKEDAEYCRTHNFDKYESAKKNDKVDHPSHYNQGKFEVIDVIEDWHLGFNLGNCVKYIGRAGHKGDTLEDLKKAQWYLNREIAYLEKKKLEEKSR